MATQITKEGVIAAADKVMAAATAEEKKEVFAALDSAAKKQVRAEIKKREELRLKTQGEGTDDDEELDWATLGGAGPSGGVPVVGKGKEPDVTEKELDEVWGSLESDDTSDFDVEASAVFDYQGFNATTVLTQVMVRGKRAGLTRSSVLRDISSMCAVAHKKGSINDRNYPKMKKSGQLEYDRLAQIYNLVKGGAKGQPPEVLTISRMGPAFSAKIIRLILDDKLSGKSFVGPMKSSTLHSCMQTQFFVSTIPSDLNQRSIDYIVALCRAYTVDQSLALTQSKKPSIDNAWENQLNFIELTRTSDHPSDDARKSMMKKIPWPSVYDKSETCFQKIKSVDSSITRPTKSEFMVDINKFA